MFIIVAQETESEYQFKITWNGLILYSDKEKFETPERAISEGKSKLYELTRTEKAVKS